MPLLKMEQVAMTQGDDTTAGVKEIIEEKITPPKNINNAVGRTRTYAPRGKLITRHVHVCF